MPLREKPTMDPVLAVEDLKEIHNQNRHPFWRCDMALEVFESGVPDKSALSYSLDKG